MSSTGKREVKDRDDVVESSAKRAASLVKEADGLVADVVNPGRWPQRRRLARVFESGHLERILALYQEAMTLDPDEPAYPWNLAAFLNRIGLNDLALSFIERAIRFAQASDDDEWGDASAHLAWAEIAVDAGQPDVALVALARARALDPESLTVKRNVTRLLDEIKRRERRSDPQRELAEKLELLAGS